VDPGAVDALDVADRARQLALEGAVVVDLLAEGAPAHVALVEELEARAPAARHRPEREREAGLVDVRLGDADGPGVAQLVGDALGLHRRHGGVEVLGPEAARDRTQGLAAGAAERHEEQPREDRPADPEDEPAALPREPVEGASQPGDAAAVGALPALSLSVDCHRVRPSVPRLSRPVAAALVSEAWWVESAHPATPAGADQTSMRQISW